MHLTDLFSSVLSAHVSKELHLVLPSSKQHVVIQVVNYVVDESSMHMVNFVELKDIASKEVDEDDLYIVNELETS